MNRKSILSVAVFCLCAFNVHAEDYEAISPDGKLKIKLQVDKGTKYEVWSGDKQLISPSSIGLNLADGRIVGNGTVKSVQRNSVDQTIDVLIGKNKTLREAYNELILTFNEDYDLVVRAYDE